MNYRNLLLLGLSSVALQGCIAAAALPIVAGGGALVRSGVSDDARRERVTVVPQATPTPAPTPALAAAEPAPPVSTAAGPITPTPMAAPTPAPVAASTSGPEPEIVATLRDVPQGPTLTTAPQPTAQPTATPPAAIVAAEPRAGLPSGAVVVASLPEEQEAAAPDLVPEPVAAAQPPATSFADVGLPPEPAAAEPDVAPALASASPAVGAPAGAAPATARPEPMRPEPTQPEPVQLAAVQPAQDAAASAAIAAPAQAPEAATLPDPAPAQEAFVTTAHAVEPPVGPSAESVFGQPGMGEGYGALASYALRTLSGGLPMPSAMLADPTSLQPIRRDCQGNAPTVVIDLDPQGSLVPIAGPLAINNELARILADLRLRNVQVAWITDRGPIDARSVRDRLVASGLDPDSQDSLYVERYPGESKQARRTALAQTQCVIAMAGDERSDFDDLYNFVRDLNDARSLEMMLGNGWFLIENPVGE